MVKMRLIPALMIYAIICSIAILFYVNDSAHAESLTDKIKESMKETEEKKQEIEQFNLELNGKFKESGYKGDISISGDNFPFGKLKLNIEVYDEKYKKDNENQIRKLAKKVLNNYEIEDIAINIEVHEDGSAERSEEDKKQAKQFDDIFTIAEKELTKKNYSIATMSIDPRTSHPNIEIEITGNKSTYEQEKEKLEKSIHDQISSKYKVDYTVTIKRKSDEEIKEEKWYPIFASITEEMNKQFEEITGFAHSFHPKPLQIIIKTSLPSGKQKPKKLVGRIEAYVHGIIKIKRKEVALDKEPYHIIIRGKDQKKIN